MSITATHDRVASSLQWPALVVLGLVLAGCGDRLKWTEQVRLADGQIIKLERYQEFDGPATYPFGPPTESASGFEFRMPVTGDKVRWRDKGELATVALIIDDGIPTLLTTPRTGISLLRFRCPSPPYLAFQYRDKKWVRVALRELPHKKLRPNLSSWNIRALTPAIEANDHFLSVSVVEAGVSVPFNGQVVDLTGLDRQEFGNLNQCDRPFNYMLRPDTGELK